MKNNEFFKTISGKAEATKGELEAYWAWRTGIDKKADFPILRDSMWDNEVSDFLSTIN